MSAAAWDFTKDPGMSRELAEKVLGERDAKRNRESENAVNKARPTFLVRTGSAGEPVISLWDEASKTVSSVRIVVLPEGAGFSLMNSRGVAVRGASLSDLLVQLDYIDAVNYEAFAPLSEYGTAVPAVCVVAEPSPPAVAPPLPAPSPPSPVVTAVPVTPPAVTAAAAPIAAGATPTVKWAIAEGDVRVEQLLGVGAFGEVFKARYRGSVVALKKLKLSVVGGANRSRSQEAQAVAELVAMQSLPWHENVVACRGAVVDANGVPTAIVAEYCAGGSLLVAIESKLWDKWKTTKARIALGVARGVEHLHAHDIVHRDLAARNVLLVATSGDDMQPKVADFGMSRAVDDAEATQLTVSQAGPLRWMAPEQLNKRAYSARSDTYSFGCVVFEIYMRERPWNELTTLKETVDAVVRGDRPKFSSKCKIPPALEAVVQRCWAHAPKDRPAMSAVREELEKVVAKLGKSK